MHVDVTAKKVFKPFLKQLALEIGGVDSHESLEIPFANKIVENLINVIP